MPYRYFTFVLTLFVVIFLLSNTVAVKIIKVGPFVFDGGTILFPLSYIFGDILTEVYGYRRSRLVIWTGFGAGLLMAVVYWLVGLLPPAPGYTGQAAYLATLGQTPRIVAASLTAYFCGEFINSYVLAKMKILTRGRWLWTRTIGSTAAGELVDSAIFVLLAFAGSIPTGLLGTMLLSNYIFKTAYEVLATPVTYGITGCLKRVEREDYYDYGTDFNPFHLSLDDLRR